MNTYINISLFGYKLNKLQYQENLRSKLQSVSLKMTTSPMKIGIGKIFVNISPIFMNGIFWTLIIYNKLVKNTLNTASDYDINLHTLPSTDPTLNLHVISNNSH